MSVELRTSDYDKFWGNVKKSNGCWIWTGCVDDRGYGRFCLNGKGERAHRVAYTISVGKIKEGLCVCHHCDNPICVNPDHLFTGTHAMNMQDKINKGRSNSPIGEAHGSSKLSTDEVKEIKLHLKNGGITQAKLAEMYGISDSGISEINTGKRWSHVQ